MAKRVYKETVKKWLIRSGIIVGTLIGGIFLYLFAIGAISNVSYSGDSICAGTVTDPCYAYINFTANEDIFIYPTNYDPWGRDTLFDFDPAVKSWKLQRSWGSGWRNIPLDRSCTGTWCGLSSSKDTRKFSVAFREGRDYQIRIVAYKNSPYDTIKWGAFSGVDEIDPNWYGVNRSIGYEFLDDGKVVHIWNTQDDYFFDKGSGIQFTNNYEDYWSKNVFCIGYYSGEEWVKIKCADELANFQKNIETDNLTYVNATLWKDINYGAYDLRIGVQYHLGLDDKNLSITIYGKNIGIDIPFDLGFAWKVTDLDIPIETIDRILINNTNYELDGVYDLTFKDMKEYINTSFPTNQTTSNGSMIYNYSMVKVPIPFYKLYDYDGGLNGKENFLRIDWNENLNYAVKLHAEEDQSNSYVMLLVDAGHFNPNQEKSTTFYWIDALIDNNVAYWKFEEASGNFLDEVASLDLTNFGVDYQATGIIDYCGDWELGNTDYASAGSSSVISIAGDMSISFWIKPESHTSTAWIIADWITSYRNYLIYLETDGKLVFVNGNGLSSQDTVIQSTTAMDDGTWYHVVLVRDAGNNLGYIYVNTSSTSGTINYNGGTTSTDINIGASSVPSSHYDGLIDEIGVWDRVLSPAEVAELYNSGSGLTYPFGPDTTPPTYSSAQINITNAGAPILFSILYDDNIALESNGEYIFSTNNTGVWANESAVNFTATPEWANVTMTLNSTLGTVVGYRWYADDNVGYSNNTGVYILTTTSNALNIIDPTTGDPESVSSGDNITIRFNYTFEDVNQTSGVNIESVFIGGSEATIISQAGVGLVLIDFEDFEGYSEGTQPDPIGNWIQATFDDDDWYVYTGNGESSSTGPTANYDGYYGMVETSTNFCNDPDEAVLYRSPEIDFDSYTSVNVSFAYNMYGATMGTLHIKENSTGSWVSKWSESGDQGTSWFTEDLKLEGLSGSGNIAIWMMCGASFTSDAAVDSVNITAFAGTTQEFAYYSGSWKVNVTVPTFESGLKDLFVNATYLGVTKNDTQTNAINYSGAPPADSCTYSSGNWAVDCSDNCSITSNVNMGGNNISLIGNGDFSVWANITNFNKIFLWDTCDIRLYPGGQLR